MPACKVCGRGAGLWSDCHPACAQQAMRTEVQRYRALAKSEWDSGTRQRIGATIFALDSVRAAFGHEESRVCLADLCWVYRSEITHWVLWPPMVFVTHELVMHVVQGHDLSKWTLVRFFGSEQEVNQSINEMMKRAPWALFGYTTEARAAMETGKRLETTREIQARRARISASPDSAQSPNGKTAVLLPVERLRYFGGYDHD